MVMQAQRERQELIGRIMELEQKLVMAIDAGESLRHKFNSDAMEHDHEKEVSSTVP